jgi:hypothetical protein
MRLTKKIAVAAVAAQCAALGGAVASAPAATAPLRHFEGTVLSVDGGARTFRLRDAQRGVVRVKVTSTTRYQRVAGFAGLHAGLTRIEVTVRRIDGAWRARLVERSGGGGRHGVSDDAGGRHGGGADDGPNHR